MFKVDNKGTRTTPLTVLLWLKLNIIAGWKLNTNASVVGNVRSFRLLRKVLFLDF